MCGECDERQRQDEAEIKSRVIKVISLWEPWATAMLLKLKKNETRSWYTKHRGWLAIHAAKKPYRPRDYVNDFNVMVQSAGIWPHRLSYGAVLCIAKLVGCEKSERVRESVSERESKWGDYSVNRYAWITSPADMIELPEPVPMRGHQGLFDWLVPEELAVKLRAEREGLEGQGPIGPPLEVENAETKKILI